MTPEDVPVFEQQAGAWLLDDFRGRRLDVLRPRQRIRPGVFRLRGSGPRSSKSGWFSIGSSKSCKLSVVSCQLSVGGEVDTRFRGNDRARFSSERREESRSAEWITQRGREVGKPRANPRASE